MPVLPDVTETFARASINTLKHQHKEFIQVAVEMHHHRRYIERYLESHKEFSKYLKDIKKLPAIWEEKILVVDDDEMIVDLLSAFFEDEGVIDRACNGKEAMEKTDENYYAAIVSDVDMPVMNGIEFYNKASEKFPNIKDRFIFFTGNADEERVSFFKKNKLRYMKKPVPINEIKNLLIDILSK
ncbi:MAG: response regulator [Nitrospirae bacterium]|nr:response regulator [Nitrospirota bacterium]